MESVEPHRSSLVWGIFLGVSWTWCIGMFLPVLLIRDLGPLAFLVFALPNVIGAAAMGWVLSRDGMSQTWVTQHRFACLAFSIITILFHIFFAGWMISLLLGAAGGIAMLLLAALLWSAGRLHRHRDLTAAMLIYLLSLLCIALFLTLGRPSLPNPTHLLPQAGLKLASLTPVCLFGFGLCPYLDLTFHRARQGVNPPGAKIAFGTGFGLFFFSMILFTLLYSNLLESVLRGYAIGLSALIIGSHMVAQGGYTVAAHLREVMTPQTPRRDAQRLTIFTAAAIGIVLCVASLTSANPAAGEVPYLIFMSFYGLLFPAYVWTAIMGKGQVNWPILSAGIILAAPFYYVGFIGKEMGWLLPGVAIAILAGVVSGWRVRRASL